MAIHLIQTTINKRLFADIFLVIIIASTVFFVVSVILWSPSMIADGWSLQHIILNVLCKIPWFLGNIYPAVIGVGTLLTFSLLAKDNELVVLQGAGLSIIHFFKISLFPALFFAMLGFLFI